MNWKDTCSPTENMTAASSVSPVTKHLQKCSSCSSTDKSMQARNLSPVSPAEKILNQRRLWTSTRWWSTRNLKRSSASSVRDGFSRMTQPSGFTWKVIRGQRTELEEEICARLQLQALQSKNISSMWEWMVFKGALSKRFSLLQKEE